MLGSMLAFDLTPWNFFWAALIIWGVWMCIVVIRFMARGESKTWERY